MKPARLWAWLGLCCLMALSDVGQAALVAEYRFEESSYNGTAGEVADLSGNGNHGKMVGSVTSTASGKVCRGISIPNNTTSTIAAFDTGIDVNTIGNEGSITFWVKLVGANNDQRMLFDATTAASGAFYLTRDDEGAGDVDTNFAVTNSGGTKSTLHENDAMSDETWQHMAVTWKYPSGSHKELNVYVNGSLVDSGDYTGTALNSAIGTLYFGDNRSSSSDYVESGYGTFDQIRIYNTVLTAAQVQADRDASPSCVALHHLEVSSSTASAAPGEAVVFTIKACANAACSTLYTGGVSGNLSISGAGVSVTYTTGAAFSIASGSSSTTETVTMTPAGTVTVGLSSVAPTASGSPAVYCGIGTAASSGGSCSFTISGGLHHLELTSSASSTVTCNPVTFTVKACADAACSTLYTSGVTGTVSASGTNVSSYSSGFTIAAGSSSTSLSTNLAISSSAVNTATATASLSGYSPTPTHGVPVYYGMGTTATSGGSQSIALSNSGLVFNVPNHEAEIPQSVTVSAIKTLDGSTACTPAFASVDKTVNFKCSYTNPSNGTRAVRVADATYNSYSALNASNSATAACDGTGADVVLKFNASGVATAKIMYADVGNMGLSALHTNGSLQMAGSDSFIALPYDFAVAITTTGNIVAGSNFNGTVTARNSAGGATPNFGRESSAEGVTLSFVRTRPRFAGAVNGSFSGTVGSFSSGAASASNLRWTEVGRGDVVASLTSGSYLGSGKRAAGSSAGSWVDCAGENATCTLPTGATATVAYGANGLRNFQTGVSGSITCSNGVFGDPIVGTAKRCAYVVTSGANTAVSGAGGPFIPHHFSVSTSHACGSFSYSGQPVSTVIRAFNAIDSVNHIYNYDGSDGTSSYNHARDVTLSDASGAGNGSWGGTNAVPASAFSAGEATVSTLAYTFSSKLTAETNLTVRATDTDGVSSNGYSEGSMKVRSGRLKFSNAFGSEKKDLHVPVQAQYWSGKAWVVNSADSCTSVPAASVAMSNHLTGKGVAATGSSAWASTAAAVTIASGNGTLVLTAPTWTAGGTGSVVGSVDVAFNLGSSSADNACLGTHPASTAASLSWLRSLNGSCAATYDRDPSARITFGMYSPETRKAIHVRDIF